MYRLEKISIPYKLKRTYTVNGFLSLDEKKKKINDIIEASKNCKINDIIDYYSFLLNSDYANTILERLEILSRFRDDKLVELYMYEDNLRLLQIVSRIINEDVYGEVLRASTEGVNVSNLEKIAMQKSKGLAMLRLARIQMNAELEFDRAYNYGKFYDDDICKELDKIGNPVDQSILVMRAIAVSSSLKISPWMVRKALPINGYGIATPNFYEGIDLGGYSDVYLSAKEYNKLLTRVRKKPFYYE